MVESEGDLVVFEFERRLGTVVRAAVSRFKGRDYLSIREWTEIQGELCPTRRGITLSVEFLPEIRQAVQALADAIEPAELEAAGGARRAS